MWSAFERVDYRAIASRHFTRPERQSLERCTVDEYPIRFLELWTLKEAYVKAVGNGLSLPLDSFAFAFEPEGGLRFSSGGEDGASRFSLAAPSPGTRMAIAVHSGVCRRDPKIVVQGHLSPRDSFPIVWLRATDHPSASQLDDPVRSKL